MIMAECRWGANYELFPKIDWLEIVCELRRKEPGEHSKRAANYRYIVGVVLSP